jgi:hypothetical protein
MRGIGWIREDGHQGDLRHHFHEELQLLPHRVVSVHRHAGDVSPWPRETDDESGHFGIISGRYDDGDCLGRSFGRPDRQSHCYDHIYLQVNQLGSQIGKPIVLPLSPSVFNVYGLPFDIAEFAQPSRKGIEMGLDERVRTGARR